MTRLMKGIMTCLLATAALATAAETVVFTEGFQKEDSWTLTGYAAVSARPDGMELDLGAPVGGESGRAASPWIDVHASGWYELEYTVQAMSPRSTYIIMPMIGYREISLLDDTLFLQAPVAPERRRIRFRATPVQSKMQLRFVAGIGLVSLKALVLRETAAPPRPAGELVLDMEFAFGHGVFAPSDAKAITGILKVNDMEATSALFTGVAPDGRRLFSEKRPCWTGELPFAVPVPELGAEYVLDVTLFDAAGRELATLSEPLAHHPHRDGQVTFRDDGVTLVDGKPFFMVAHWWFTRRGDTGGNVDWWYENDQDAADDMVFLKNAGFNTLLVRTPEQVRLAGERGLKAIIEYPHRLPGADKPQEREAAIATYTRKNEILRQDPALLAYYGPDEPLAFVCPFEKIMDSSELVHRLDPYHPIFYNESPTGPAEMQHDYSPWCDVTGRDVYPVPNLPEVHHGDLPIELKLSSVGAHTDICRKSVYDRKPVWMILQAFGWHHIYGGRNVKKVEEVTDCKIYYPTYEESRFMAYNAITHGATGLLYHYLGYTVHVPEYFWHGLYNVLQELAFLNDVLVARTVVEPSLRCLSPDVRVMAKDCDGENCYFVVNETDQPVEAVFLNCPERELHALFGTAPIAVADGEFRLAMKPYEVLVLREQPFPPAEDVLHPENCARYDDFPTLREPVPGQHQRNLSPWRE